MKKLLFVVLVLGLATPAMGAEWGWYGSVRTHLGMYATDEYFAGGPMMDSTISGFGNEFDGEADTGTFVNVGGQNTLGARVKVSDQLFAQVELGLTNCGLRVGDDRYEREDIYLRHIYGKYQMGPGSLLVGKFFTPASFVGYSGMTGDVGDMGDAIMLSSALTFSGRRGQIRYSVAGLDIALVEHAIDDPDGRNLKLTGTDSDGNSITYDDADFALPKIELAYQFNHPIFSLRPILGYQSFTIEANSPGDDESETITSMLYGLGVNLRFGMAKVNMTYAMSTNPGNYGVKCAGPFLYASTPGNPVPHQLDVGRATIMDGDVEDAEGTQASLVVNLKFNPTVSLELGYGYMKLEQAVTADIDGEQQSNIYYLNVPITVGPGMTITPEFGVLDRGVMKFTDDIQYYDIGKLGMPGTDFDPADPDNITLSDEAEAGVMSWFSVRFAVDF